MKTIANTIIFKTWFDIAEKMQTNAERGQFYHGICRYAFTGVEPRFTGMMNTYFELIKPLIDKKKKERANYAKYHRKDISKTCENNCENDCKNDCKSDNKADAPAMPARAVDDTRASINNNSQEREKNKEKEKEVTFAGLLPLHLQTPSFLAKWQEWERFRRLKRKPISRMAAVRQIKMLSELDPLMAAQAIDNSIQNDYQGLFPPSRGAAVRNLEQPKRKDYTGV